MGETVGYDDMVSMIRTAGKHIRANVDKLTELDSATGDGDHGAAMVRSMDLADDAIKAAGGGDLKGLLHDIGWAIMGGAGGATGPLLGCIFMGMSEGTEGKESLDVNDLAELLEAGLAKVRKQTKADVGDKTMIDALVPGVQALRAAADENASIPEALVRAADAAAGGAQSTVSLIARFGRAKNLGARGIGTKDPGATSIALLFRGFSEAQNDAGDETAAE